MGSGPWLVAVMGPTASGKTAFAERLAPELHAQLINADAFQVYRGLDVGTGKPPNKGDYRLLDLKEPWEEFGVGEWVLLASQELQRLFAQGRSAVVVGGTGYYVRALFDEWQDLKPPPPPGLREELEALRQERGLCELVRRLHEADPEAARTVDPRNPARVRRALERALAPSEPIRFELPPFRRLKLALDVPLSELGARIDRRAGEMLAGGWPEEVAGLLESGVQANMPGMRAIGYSDVARLVSGEIGQEDALRHIQTKTKQYAKRQRTWLRSEKGLSQLAVSDVADPFGALWPQVEGLLGET